jgi:eukaryotic-like serine/threonine-protein kinase
VLGRGLDPDPDRRPLSAGRLISELETALEPGGASTVATRPAKPVTITVSSRSLLRAIAIGGLAAGVAVVIAVLVASGDGGSPTASAPAANAGPDRPGEGAGQSSGDSGPIIETTTATTTTTAPAPAPGLSGAELNDQGYALTQAGRYEEAIPLLQRAVESFPNGTSDINYAYALFNLGQALRLAGRPDEAIPILEQRLEIPDQVETVERALAAARAAAAGGEKPKRPKKPNHEE